MGYLMNWGKFSKMHSIVGEIVERFSQSGLPTHETTAAPCIHLITSQYVAMDYENKTYAKINPWGYEKNLT